VNHDRSKVRFEAACHCGAVRYAVNALPVDAKLCHCKVCQKVHGAPMQWAAIFDKTAVEFLEGENNLKFYNTNLKTTDRILPCKVGCRTCGSWIADDGRRMWLAFPSLFDFSAQGLVPEAFKPSCHIFYAERVVNVDDTLPKWSGHKNKSTRL
jgi:hypothetical protein